MFLDVAFTYGDFTGSELVVVVLKLGLVEVHVVGVGETVEMGGTVDDCFEYVVAAEGSGVAPEG